MSASNKLIDEYGIGVCLSHLVLFSLYQLQTNSKNLKIIVDGKIKILEDINPILSQKIINQNPVLDVKIDQFKSFVGCQKLDIIRENFADDKYLAVALASNIAKVYRDKIMTDLSDQFPEFSWDKNKGYGTKIHRKAILNCNGYNNYLRQTFLQKILIDRN